MSMANGKPARRGTGRSRATNAKPKKARTFLGRPQRRKPAAKKRSDKPSLMTRIRERVRSGFGRHADDLWGVLLIVAGVLVGLAFFGLAGPVGGGITTGLEVAFGVWGYVVSGALIALGAALVIARPRNDYGRIAGGFLITFVSSLALFHLMTGAVSLAASIDIVRERGGAVGALLSFPLRRVIGFWGAFVVLTALTAVGVLVLTRTTIRDLGLAFSDGFSAGWQWMKGLRGRRARRPEIGVQPDVVATQPERIPDRPVPEAVPAEKTARPAPKPKPVPRPAAASGYERPPLELLSLGGGSGHNKRLLDETARELEETLIEHGVDARLTRIVPGPTVTRYEIELAPGVKVAKVTGLAHDIAYALATPDVRILAPIPGRSAIGVEVPNRRRQLVTLGDILRSPEAKEADHPLSVALGMDISGRPVMLNLHELPHVLIAGATGAGKSSCINAVVTSILMRTTPDQVRMILVDPKRVELGQYNDVPHLLTRVITNPKKAADALQWAVREMDRRYDQLADAGVRDIDGYIEKWDAGALDTERFDRFPWIVVVVDELNDLMMVAGRTVEEAVVRIAQMARAVGIHLVIATQRPSVDVITGVIKANVPSRLAFSVASQADSRVILDMGGAEKLVGLGDMIVVTARDPKAERVQGAWVGEEEIHAVVDWVHRQQQARYEEAVTEEAQEAATAADDDEGEDAEILRQAIELVVRSQLGSTSMLQRKLRIGFARAGRVMDILERKGIVGPSEGSKARAVLVSVEELDDVLSGEPVTT
jgi:S-DNA-T family DNA segregation ATPase FtsK/SpoIIIE